MQRPRALEPSSSTATAKTRCPLDATQPRALTPRALTPIGARPLPLCPLTRRYGAIPLIVSDHIYRVGLPFQCWVPWRLMVIHLKEADFLRNVTQALRRATELAPAAEARMRQLIGHFGKDLLWRHPRSRVAENVLLAARRWRSRGKPLLGCCPMHDEVALEMKA